MPFAIRSKLEGLDELRATLSRFGQVVQTKALRKGVLAAGTIILKVAKSRVPTKSRLLRKSLGKKVSVYKSGIAAAIVGPRTGFRQTVTRDGRAVLSDPTKYAHLVEKGVRAHAYAKRKGLHPGTVAKPFLEPARSTTVRACQEAIQDAILTVLEGAVGL